MTISIWLDDKSNVELGFLVRGTSKRPGLPSTVDRTLSIPGRNGIRDYGADIDARQFIIDGAFNTRNYIELQQRVMNLAAYLVDSYGKPRTLQLRFAERPNQYFNVRLVGSFDIDRIMGLGMFSLPFTAFDPFARDAEKIHEQTIVQSLETITIISSGNIRTEPVITITNTGTTTLQSFKISNEYEKK